MRPANLARFNSIVLVVVVGMTVGHLLLPFASPHPWLRAAELAAILFILGAMRGHRDRTVRRAAARRPPGTPRAAIVESLVWGLAAVALAAIAFLAVHGRP